MTKARLLQAIQSHDPDGGALGRVLAAARSNTLRQCASLGGCLLSVAWSNERQMAVVQTYSLYIVPPGAFFSFAVHADIVSSIKHDCDDVVRWFDADLNLLDCTAANQKVLALLETTDDD